MAVRALSVSPRARDGHHAQYHAKKFEELNLKEKSKEPKAKKKKAKQKASNRGPVQPLAERPGPLHSGSASTKASTGLVRRHLDLSAGAGAGFAGCAVPLRIRQGFDGRLAARGTPVLIQHLGLFQEALATH